MRHFILALPLVVFACGDDDVSSTPSADAGTGPDSSSTDSGGGGNDSGGGNDAGSDTGNGSSVGPGPYTILYAGTFAGIDARSVADGKATFSGFTLTGYTATGQETDEMPSIGTNTAKDVAGTSLFAIGRWAGGTTDGKFYEAGAAGKMTFAANGGFHYGIGRPSDPIPSTGAATYTLDQKTAATVSDGSQAPGTITGALAMNLAGATTKIGLSVTIDIPGSGTYTAETTGGTADPSQSDAFLNTGGGPSSPKATFYFNKTGVTNAGAACNGGTCSLGVYGFIAGQNAENVLMAVHFYAGAGGSPTSVSGILAFKK